MRYVIILLACLGWGGWLAAETVRHARESTSAEARPRAYRASKPATPSVALPLLTSLPCSEPHALVSAATTDAGHVAARTPAHGLAVCTKVDSPLGRRALHAFRTRIDRPRLVAIKSEPQRIRLTHRRRAA